MTQILQALCEGLARGAAPSLLILRLSSNNFGPAGTEPSPLPSAGARCQSSMPGGNPIGNQGVAALAPPLRKMPALKELLLGNCEIGDEGVASLVDNLGKDEFKVLEELSLNNNKITNVGMAKLLAALDAGGLPKLARPCKYVLDLEDNPASAVAVAAVQCALAKRLEAEQLKHRWRGGKVGEGLG